MGLCGWWGFGSCRVVFVVVAGFGLLSGAVGGVGFLVVVGFVVLGAGDGLRDGRCGGFALWWWSVGWLRAGCGSCLKGCSSCLLGPASGGGGVVVVAGCPGRSDFVFVLVFWSVLSSCTLSGRRVAVSLVFLVGGGAGSFMVPFCLYVCRGVARVLCLRVLHVTVVPVLVAVTGGAVGCVSFGGVGRKLWFVVCLGVWLCVVGFVCRWCDLGVVVVWGACGLCRLPFFCGRWVFVAVGRGRTVAVVLEQFLWGAGCVWWVLSSVVCAWSGEFGCLSVRVVPLWRVSFAETVVVFAVGVCVFSELLIVWFSLRCVAVAGWGGVCCVELASVDSVYVTAVVLVSSKRRAFWSLNEDILKITILKTNTPYPSRKIRRIRACTHQRPQRNKLNTLYLKRLNTPYSKNGINIIFWKISSVVPTPRNSQYAVSNTGDLDNSTSNVLIPLDSWTSGLLVYKLPLSAFSDADHAGCIDTRKSTSGGIQFLGDKLVSWMSKKQDCTAMSSVEAEYVTLSASYAQEHVENGIIELYFVRTEYQLADMFTKALPEDRFQYLVRLIGMRCLTPAELEVIRRCCSLIPAESDSLPHAHTQTTKTYYKHQDSRIKKAQELKTKTSAYSDIKDNSSETKLQGRLLASFQEDAKYEHVSQDTRSQGGKDDQD
ncbi:hypothetical protein Tco_0545830 [Tanacetum coccineum]